MHFTIPVYQPPTLRFHTWAPCSASDSLPWALWRGTSVWVSRGRTCGCWEGTRSVCTSASDRNRGGTSCCTPSLSRAPIMWPLSANQCIVGYVRLTVTQNKQNFFLNFDYFFNNHNFEKKVVYVVYMVGLVNKRINDMFGLHNARGSSTCILWIFQGWHLCKSPSHVIYPPSSSSISYVVYDILSFICFVQKWPSSSAWNFCVTHFLSILTYFRKTSFSC